MVFRNLSCLGIIICYINTIWIVPAWVQRFECLWRLGLKFCNVHDTKWTRHVKRDCDVAQWYTSSGRKQFLCNIQDQLCGCLDSPWYARIGHWTTDGEFHGHSVYSRIWKLPVIFPATIQVRCTAPHLPGQHRAADVVRHIPYIVLAKRQMRSSPAYNMRTTV